jgi:hypothetical protein
MATADLRALTIGDFEPRKDETFAIKLPQGELTLKLTHIRPLGDSGREGGAFSLWFVSAPGPLLPQMIYPVVHPEMGELKIFLVPLGPRDGGFLYESIFT